MSEMKPCPLCNGKGYSMPRKINIANRISKNMGWVCGCGKCDLHVYGDDQISTEKVWNTRPIEDALQARIAELEARQRWIPVSERLPEEGTPVLVHFNELNDVIIAHHDSFHPSWETGGDWNYMDEEYNWATHWMPLPEPPEESDNDPA